MTSNIDSRAAQHQTTAAEATAARLATDAVAAVIDESAKRGDQPTLADLTDRLAQQFHNLPGFDEAEFRSRASASARIAELQGSQAPASQPSRPSQPSQPSQKKAS